MNAFSQSLPNSDMEDWDNVFFIYWEPHDWFTLNPFIVLGSGGDAVAVEKSTDAYSGNYSAKITTTEITISEQLVVVPGILTLAEFSLNLSDSTFSFTGGYFLQENVKSLRGYYKYSAVEDDSASVLIYNYKNEGGVTDTIGFGFSFLSPTDEWQAFEVEMQNINNAVPDTFNVLFSSSSGLSAQEGSSLYIDSISIETNTGIIDLWSPKTKMKIYPNPALNNITFNTNKIENNRILTIYDNFGKPIIVKDFPKQTIKLNISYLSSGIYTYKLSKGNKILNSGSFIKN